MAPVSTICSLILALMVALSGGANVAEIPEVMDVLTLRNLALEVKMFEEEASIEFPMEFVLSSAVGANAGTLHFEMHDEDGSVLLPLSGKIVSDALQFAIGDSENAYGIYEQTLRDEMMLTEQDEQLLAGLGDTLGYIVENDMMQDAEMALSVMDVMCILADQKQVDAEEASVFYGDGEYAAQKRSCTVTREEFDALLEAPPAALSEEERKAVEAYAVIDGYYKLMEDYAAAMQDYVGEASPVNLGLSFGDSVDVEITEAEVEGEAYLSVKQNYSVNDTDFELEYVTYGQNTRIGQRSASESVIDDELVQNSVVLEYVYEGSVLAPEMVSMVGMYRTHTEIDAYSFDDDMYISMTGGVTDGLWDVQGDVSIVSSSNDGYSSESTAQFSYAETLEDDDSKTGHVSLNVQLEGMLEIGVSFDLNFAEAPYADFFAGREVIWLEEMTEEQAIALEDEWVEVLEAAGTAYENWVEKVEEELEMQSESYEEEYIEYEVYEDKPSSFRTNNSIRESIREKFVGAEVKYVVEYEVEEYEDYEEYEGYEEEYVIPEYYSWAEAQEHFNGKIPGYTAPEKWPLVKIEMFHEDYMYAYFGEEYDGFAIDISSYGNENMERFVLQDGAMVPFESVLVDCYSHEGNVFWATFDYGSCAVNIYFNGEGNHADLEAILAGFEF